LFAPENRPKLPPPKGKFIFQPLIFRAKMFRFREGIKIRGVAMRVPSFSGKKDLQKEQQKM